MTIEVTNLVKPFIDGYKVINDEWNHFFEIGLEEYLQSQAEKYYFTNTFLHRQELVKFSDFYYPVTIQHNDYQTSLENPSEIFSKTRFLMIMGSAGSGKSTLVKYIFLNAIMKSFKIPLLIELRHLNDFDGDLERLVKDKIISTDAAPSERIVKRLLKKGDFLILLDGYDEIFSNKKQKVNSQIESFVDSYSKNCFVITSRPGAGMECFSRFQKFDVQPLSPSDIESFVILMVKNNERRERLLSTINDEKNRGYIHYLSNPLLLSMFILAFESHPEIPDKKNAFYKNVFDTLYSKHDGVTKNSFPREKKTKLQRDDFENVLSLFSFLSLTDAQINFTEEYIGKKISVIKQYYGVDFLLEDIIYDFVTSISIFIKEGFEYKFPHRSMQEYFAALFISKLPTDKKFDAYDKLMKVIENKGNDRSLNLLEICMEIDYVPFLKSYVIPKLKAINSQFDSKNDLTLVSTFFKAQKAHMYKFSQSKHYSFMRMATYDTSFSRFFNLIDFKMVTDFFKREDIQKEIESYLKKNKLKSSILPLRDEPLDILLKNNFADIVKHSKSTIENKIAFFEEAIKSREENINDLLFR